MFNTYLPQILIAIGMMFTFAGGFIAFKRSKESSEKIKDLNEKTFTVAEKTHNQLTGGDSYCVLYPSIILDDKNKQQSSLIMFNKGKFPMSDVELSYCDLDFINNKFGKTSEVSMEMLSYYRKHKVGTIKPNMGTTIPDIINVKESEVVRLSIQMFANSGNFVEELLISRLDNKIIFAIRLYSTDENSKILEENINPDFPKDDNGNINWIKK